jgi:hypothetical protein
MTTHENSVARSERTGNVWGPLRRAEKFYPGKVNSYLSRFLPQGSKEVASLEATP